jgi:hypothetical protein
VEATFFVSNFCLNALRDLLLLLYILKAEIFSLASTRTVLIKACFHHYRIILIVWILIRKILRACWWLILIFLGSTKRNLRLMHFFLRCQYMIFWAIYAFCVFIIFLGCFKLIGKAESLNSRDLITENIFIVIKHINSIDRLILLVILIKLSKWIPIFILIKLVWVQY